MPGFPRISSNNCAKFCKLTDLAPPDYDYEECFESLMIFWKAYANKIIVEAEINTTFYIFFTIVMVLMTSIGFFLLLNQKLNMHPYRLYASEILCCACFYWNWYSWYLIPYYVELTRSQFFGLKQNYRREYQLGIIIAYVNELIEYHVQLLYPMLNCLLFIDLFWIIKDPFCP